LDSEGNAKICDFGSCLKFGIDDGMNCGAIQYLAPELNSESEFSYEVDFWSLGIAIFKLLTSEFPFNTVENAINDQIPDLNEKRKIKNTKYEISQVTINLVSRLLTKNPNQRLGSKASNENIRDDPFFRCINWTQLEKGEIKPPIKPKRVKIYAKIEYILENNAFILKKSKIDTDFLNAQIDLRHLGAQKKNLDEYRSFRYAYENFDYNLKFIRNN
jgi:serine/threonine protein kinase